MAQVLAPHHNPLTHHAVAGRISCKSSSNEQVRKWRALRTDLQQELRAVLARSLCHDQQGLTRQALNRLCSCLIDYLSTGHACIYLHASTTSRHQPGHEDNQPDNLFRLIGDSTDLLLGVTRKFELAGADVTFSTLQADLYRLQRSLQVRFTLEEQLLELKGRNLRGRTVRGSTHRRGYWRQSS